VSEGGITDGREEDMGRSNRGQTEPLSLHIPLGTKENDEIQSGSLVTRPKFELAISRIQVQSVYFCANVFGEFRVFIETRVYIYFKYILFVSVRFVFVVVNVLRHSD
jgi:hypothetical protein